jgi:hypothetical protein
MILLINYVQLLVFFPNETTRWHYKHNKQRTIFDLITGISLFVLPSSVKKRIKGKNLYPPQPFFYNQRLFGWCSSKNLKSPELLRHANLLPGNFQILSCIEGKKFKKRNFENEKNFFK